MTRLRQNPGKIGYEYRADGGEIFRHASEPRLRVGCERDFEEPSMDFPRV
jgi:hypothetical protein